MKLVRVHLVLAAAVALVATASAQVTQLVSVGTGGVPANGVSLLPSVSDDGRYVVFSSEATNLVAGDTNGVQDVFLRDRISGTTERISVDSNEVQGNDYCLAASHPISADGRYVAFQGSASNLVAGDTNATSDVFVRDRQTGTTERVSVSSAEIQGNGVCDSASISADGRYVAFSSSATNLVNGDSNGWSDVFVRDRQAGTTARLSVNSSEIQANSFSGYAQISADGGFVAFSSRANNLVSGDTNGVSDIFVRDRQGGTTERVSLDTAGGQFTTDCSSFLAISGDGGFVAFTTPEFAPGESIYARDRAVPVTHFVMGAGSGFASGPQFAGNDLFLAFVSNLLIFPPDTNSANDVFVWDEVTATGARESVSSSGAQGNASSGIYGVGISPDRRFVVFDAIATNLVAGDTNGFADIFIRDRAATSFTSLCSPGFANTRACPCGNPPSSFGRGCDNSASTGGAMLSASGAAYLSEDSLVFTTQDERPTATSVFWQGMTFTSVGFIYGQGVRCVSGNLKRLFVENAVGGSITVPDFGAGDPTISAASAARGAPISPGETRHYMVSYRDPIVLGGCPSSSTFNVTQTGSVAWGP